ncbi:conserved Plasmodium protein, unknown function [Plasmodium yoelii]|uniref:Uncharacterized protein n=1 Tax=Plasmodium yoelii TaxID=5861 RepID=A0A4V0KPZ5_PLAYE|nr:conserved Plasmodium protein, unknown function [Plasmodium yoelii]VTZ79459.1 conserved Plasmodium protein, unknown function [Plasmodium yoelii]|eukprot:XP_725473.3 conserved Plasmodium protein, unknown function [Plasmodium yoelii]
MGSKKDENIDDGIELKNKCNLENGDINIENENYNYFDINQREDNEKLNMGSIGSSENLFNKNEEMGKMEKMEKMEKIMNEINESEKEYEYLENIDKQNFTQFNNNENNSESIQSSNSNKSNQSDSINDQDISEDCSESEEASQVGVDANEVDVDANEVDVDANEVDVDANEVDVDANEVDVDASEADVDASEEASEVGVDANEAGATVESIFENDINNNYALTKENVYNNSTELGNCEKINILSNKNELEQNVFTNSLKKNEDNIISVINKKISKRKNNFFNLFKKKNALNIRGNNEEDKNCNQKMDDYKTDNSYINEKVDMGKVKNNDTMNGDTMNGDTMNGDTMNGDTMNGDTMNGDTMNGDTMNGDTMNDDTMNGEDGKRYDSSISEEKELTTKDNSEYKKVSIDNSEYKKVSMDNSEYKKVSMDNSEYKKVSIDNSVDLKNIDSKSNFTELQNKINSEKDEHGNSIRYCIQTSDNLILDVKDERIGIINLNNGQENFIKNNKKNGEAYNNINNINNSMGDDFINEREFSRFQILTTIPSGSTSIKKIYSFDKIKSFVSNNTFLRKKTSTLLKRKSQISKELHFFCYNYNNLLCFIFYILCFGFIISSLYYDSWKRHEIKLKSDNMKKIVQVNIGSTTIKRIQKIINSNGDVIYSIDKDQKMDSLLEHRYCKNVKKEDLENFLIDLASKNKLKNNEEEIFNSKKNLNDSFLLQALLDIGDVGLLKDEKIILSRKYIFGSTIYNLECKFLGRLKKAGIFHKILLYVILVFLFISISLLLFIIIKYKSIQNIQIIKYISFVLVNFALITLISTMFSITREYNIPLCVQTDGSSDICVDGRSIHLIRASIILIIFSNLFFCKFINIINNNIMDDVVV